MVLEKLQVLPGKTEFSLFSPHSCTKALPNSSPWMIVASSN